MGYINGFGVDLHEIKEFKDLYEFVKKHLKEYFEEKLYLLGEITEDNIKYIVDDYESGGYFGISALLKDVINEQEGLQLSSIEEGYLYVPETFPWKFNNKMRSLSEEDFCSIFRKYLSEITNDPLEIKWLKIYKEEGEGYEH